MQMFGGISYPIVFDRLDIALLDLLLLPPPLLVACSELRVR